jgi:hypothetical protein
MTNAARHHAPLAGLLAALAVTFAACDGSSQKPPPKVEPAPVAAPPAAPAEPPPPAPAAAMPEKAAEPAPVAAPAPAPAAAPVKPAAKAKVVDKVEKAEKVASGTKKGEREKVGAGQCRVCHPIQYNSWVKSGHARKGLDCEGCHGDGSEYAKNAVMRDPAKAKAAGLIFQKAPFCEKCHPTATDAFLPKAHAHKPKAE